MKTVRLIAWVLCAAPMVASGEHGDPRADTRADGIPRRPMERWQPHGPRPSEPVSDAEWKTILAWMETHCPNRYAFASKRNIGESIKQLIAERYRLIDRTNFKPLNDAL